MAVDFGLCLSGFALVHVLGVALGRGCVLAGIGAGR
jgi:hypothetical protein